LINCNWCSREEAYFELRQNEQTGKWKIWDNNLGIFHNCPENISDQREKDEYEARKKLLKDKKMISKIPLFCITCQKSFLPREPCSHILADGYIVGKDDSRFYANTKQAEEKRNLIKKQLKIKNTPKPFSPQRKLF
jgi:hypothetical protein